jgi:TRAP-type transport system periplasmic protein
MYEVIVSPRCMAVLALIGALVVGASGIPVGSAGAQAGKAPVVELRAGTSSPKNNVISNGVDKLAELVERKTNGEVRVRVFYQSLGVERTLAEAVMAGSVDVGQFGQANAASHTNAFLVYNLPFVFKNYDDVFKSAEEPVGRKVIDQFEKDLGVKLLFLASFGSGRDLQTRKPVHVPADLKGVKIRANPTPVDQSTFKAWGANPTPVDWGQMYSALQQGIVDGMQVDAFGYFSIKAYEVVKHHMRLGYQADFSTIFINPKKLASLSPQHQTAILEAGREAGAWQRKHAAEQLANVLGQLRKNGVEIYQPTPDQYAQWTSVREKVWQDVGEQMKGRIDMSAARQLYDAYNK